MGKAHISLISKPKEDKIDCTSTTLVSLLNTGTKIFFCCFLHYTLSNNTRKIHISKN